MKFVHTKEVHKTEKIDSVIDLPETPVFVRLIKYRQVIGIYPTFWESEEEEDGRIHKYKRLLFDIYIGEQNECKHLRIVDYELNGFMNENSLYSTLRYIITADRQYEDKMTEDEFVKEYNNYKKDLSLPKK